MLLRIKLLCSQNKVTITALERNCGFSKGSMCKWDKSTPSFDKVQKVADYFGVSPQWLATGEGPMRPSYFSAKELLPEALANSIFGEDDIKKDPILSDEVLSETDMEFLALWKTVAEEDKAVALATLRALAKKRDS